MFLPAGSFGAHAGARACLRDFPREMVCVSEATRRARADLLANVRHNVKDWSACEPVEGIALHTRSF